MGGTVGRREGGFTAGATEVVPEQTSVLDDGIDVVCGTGDHAVGRGEVLLVQ